jgi:hypothetical protein
MQAAGVQASAADLYFEVGAKQYEKAGDFVPGREHGAA